MRELIFDGLGDGVHRTEEWTAWTTFLLDHALCRGVVAVVQVVLLGLPATISLAVIPKEGWPTSNASGELTTITTVALGLERRRVLTLVCSSVRLGHNDYADSGAWGRIPGITIMLDCAPEKNHPRGACPRKIFAAASPQAEKSPQLAQSVQCSSAPQAKLGKSAKNVTKLWSFSGVAPAQRGRNG